MPQLATEIMTRAFKPEYIPGTSMTGFGTVAEWDCGANTKTIVQPDGTKKKV